MIDNWGFRKSQMDNQPDYEEVDGIEYVNYMWVFKLNMG